MNTPFQYFYQAPKVEGQKQPAIFLFHGLGSNEKDLLQLVEGFGSNCHIFSLQGPIKHQPGYAFYTFPAEEGKPERQIFDRVALAAQKFILDAIQEFDISLDQIYVMGFNQGAVIAQALATVMGNMLRSVVVLSGFLPDFVENEYNKAPMDRLNVFIAHGEYDYVYPISWGQASADYFERMQANVTYFTFEDGHGVTPAVLEALTAFLKSTMPDVLEN